MIDWILTLIAVVAGLVILNNRYGKLGFSKKRDVATNTAFIVASIDFGTTFSGWALSFRTDFKRDPLNIKAKNWPGSQPKAPTCILIKPDKTTVESFGYEAEDRYIELTSIGQHKKYYFFKQFKMMLYGQGKINRNMTLTDATGKTMQALTVFSLAIRFLKDDLHSSTAGTLKGKKLQKNDIHWVLTVPAIWKDDAKQFMREAAEKAGIARSRLTIALEPEAASLLCRHLPMENKGNTLSSMECGTKYIVLDAGGGTVDITVHEVSEEGTLNEIYQANGGDWGGTNVDKAFEKFIDKIAGKGVMEKFRNTHMDDYLELRREFEIRKREISPNDSKIITIRIPQSLAETVGKMTHKSLKENVQQSVHSETVKVIRDKLRIRNEVALTFFEDSVSKIVAHVSELLYESRLSGCRTILMVGGFSDSQVLQSAMREKFKKMEIICPKEAVFAVMKGAVMFGYNPASISERVCKYTYGQQMSHYFQWTCSHRTSRRGIDADGAILCLDLFHVHVQAGQTVVLGEEQPEVLCYPLHNDQIAIEVAIYASKEKNPELVTDDGCNKIGKLTVPVPYYIWGRRRRSFGTRFIFSGTEIKVRVEDKVNGKTFETFVDFLG